MKKRIRIALMDVPASEMKRGEPYPMTLIKKALAERNVDAVILIFDRDMAEEVAPDKKKQAPKNVITVDTDDPADVESKLLEVRRRCGRNARFRLIIKPSLSPYVWAVLVMIFRKVFPSGRIMTLTEEFRAVTSPIDTDFGDMPELFKRSDDQIQILFFAASFTPSTFDGIIHKCDKMKEVIRMGKILAQRDIPVLIEGETGTGKEIIAHAIHAESQRSKEPFVVVNCGAIPTEIFESEIFGHEKGAFSGAIKKHDGKVIQADKGTLFLDEIGELPLNMQVKLLRVIQDGVVSRLGGSKDINVDFRVIAATNSNLMSDVAEGRFREDLFYRLAVGYIRIPPIRKRESDIDLLIDHILDEINEAETNRDPTNYIRKILSADAKMYLSKEKWLGNFRELRSTMLRAALVCSSGSTIELKDVEKGMLGIPTSQQIDILNKPFIAGFKIEEVLNEVKQHYLQRAWIQSGKHKTKAAELVGLNNYQTFVKMCEGVGIDIPVKKKKTN